MINYGKQSIDKIDVESVSGTLKSDWLTQGPKVSEFEDAFSKYCGSKYAVAVSNGTAALHLANTVAGTKEKSEVITTPISFLATSNSVLYAGGRPFFVDIKQNNFTIDANKIEDALNMSSNIEGIIPVHFGGVLSDLDRIKEIAIKNDLWVIEDACHALGGKWLDKNGTVQKVGNCSHSAMTTFSFHPVKHITTGEGGAITTNSKKIYDELITLRSHGMNKNTNISEARQNGEWFYTMERLGYNYRMTDFQAALGIEQLKKSDSWVKKRREIVSFYDHAFEDLDEILPQAHPDKEVKFSYHLYVIQCEKRKELYEYLKNKKINTQVHYIPIHLQPYYMNNFDYKKGDFPIAENYYDKALSLPLHPSLSVKDLEKIVYFVKKFYESS